MSTPFHQTRKSDLMVPTHFNLCHLEERAEMIVSSCLTSGQRICIVMMHTPSDAQLDDLNHCLNGQNKDGWDKVALVGGQLGLMLQVVPVLKTAGFLVVEAVSDRISVENTMPDGTIQKKSVFKHMGLRRL